MCICKRMYCFHPLSTRVSCIFPVDSVRLNKSRMKLFPNTIDRNGDVYPRSHYRAHWQPLWATLGLVLCTLLAVTRGWTSIYDLCVASPGVSKEDSIVDLIADYLGVSHSSPLSANCRNDPVNWDCADMLESHVCFSACIWRTS